MPSCHRRGKIIISGVFLNMFKKCIYVVIILRTLCKSNLINCKVFFSSYNSAFSRTEYFILLVFSGVLGKPGNAPEQKINETSCPLIASNTAQLLLYKLWFNSIWFILNQFDSIWFILNQSDSIRFILNQFDSIGFIWNLLEPICINLYQFESIWIILD